MECTRHQNVKIFVLLVLATISCLPGRAQTAAPEPSVAIVYDGAAGPKEYQSKGYIQNHRQGMPVSRQITLPAQWKELLARSRQRQLSR